MAIFSPDSTTSTKITCWPKISIVTPIFNQVNYLEKTILSVITQDYPNLEYIIIDGGSTDGSVEIIKKYSDQLAYWSSEPDNGMYYALQKGFEFSTGEIMGWINADDLLHKKSLFTIAEVFRISDKIKWITGLPTTIDKTDRIVSLLNVRKWSRFNYLQKDFDVIQQESTYWKRELWLQAGSCLNLEFKYAGDLELWARFFKYEKLYSITAPIGCFRTRPMEQLSSIYAKQYLSEAHQVLSSMPKTKDDEKALKRLSFFNKHKRLLKSDTLKSKYNRIYDYPGLINYDFERQIFIYEGDLP